MSDKPRALTDFMSGVIRRLSNDARERGLHDVAGRLDEAAKGIASQDWWSDAAGNAQRTTGDRWHLRATRNLQGGGYSAEARRGSQTFHRGPYDTLEAAKAGAESLRRTALATLRTGYVATPNGLFVSCEHGHQVRIVDGQKSALCTSQVDCCAQLRNRVASVTTKGVA